jgi:hypothetical protein
VPGATRRDEGRRTGEEFLAEDITGSIQGHWPEHEESDGHEDSHAAGDDCAFLEMLLLRLIKNHLGCDGLSTYGLDIDVELRGNIAIVTLIDGSHRVPVVLLLAEGEGENRDEDNRTEQSCYVACQHGIVGACALDRQAAALLLCRDEPGNKRAGEAKHRSTGSCDPILAIPCQCQCCWDDG